VRSEKNVKPLHLFAQKKSSSGPWRKRHSTCRHMVVMAHHTNPRGYKKKLAF